MPRFLKSQSIASRARHLVELQQYSPSSDGEGGYVDGWVTIGTVWASVDPLTAYQRMDYSSISTDVTHLVTIRGNINVDDTQQVLFDGRSFEVLTHRDVQERGIEKTLMCRERSR